MGMWAITQLDGDDQIFLETPGTPVGAERRPWSTSLCSAMVDGRGPRIASDVAIVPAYVQANVVGRTSVGSYAGCPIRLADGRLYGTLCGIDPSPQPIGLHDHAPLLELLGALLSAALEADLVRADHERELEVAELAAETDAITGLMNRHGWDRSIQHEEAVAQRSGHLGSVIVIDLDNLKSINDSSGHLVGDDYIGRAGEAIRRSIRAATDIAARISGDEFGVIAINSTPHDAQRLVERITDAFDDLGVSASIGHAAISAVAGFPHAFETADREMYRQKLDRRDR